MRTKPQMDFTVDLTTVEGIVQYAEFYLNRAALIAAQCMTDHLDDSGIIGDCHDIIGDVASARNAVELISTRAITKPAHWTPHSNLPNAEPNCPGYKSDD